MLCHTTCAQRSTIAICSIAFLIFNFWVQREWRERNTILGFRFFSLRVPPMKFNIQFDPISGINTTDICTQNTHEKRDQFPFSGSSRTSFRWPRESRDVLWVLWTRSLQRHREHFEMLYLLSVNRRQLNDGSTCGHSQNGLEQHKLIREMREFRMQMFNSNETICSRSIHSFSTAACFIVVAAAAAVE